MRCLKEGGGKPRVGKISEGSKETERERERGGDQREKEGTPHRVTPILSLPPLFFSTTERQFFANGFIIDARCMIAQIFHGARSFNDRKIFAIISSYYNVINMCFISIIIIIIIIITISIICILIDYWLMEY